MIVHGTTLLEGDCLELLKAMPEESVHCCVTSPPYWGLRDYKVDGQLGLEKTPEEYVAAMVAVFREVRRVLRKDGTCWLNLGDSYAGSWGNSGNRPELDKKGGIQRDKNCDYLPRGGWDDRRERPASSYKIPGLKPKDLVGIPWRVAFALQADGWYLRQDIIWAKPNPMPESVRDRCTKSHEYIFMLSKEKTYYYDWQAVSEPVASSSSLARLAQPNLANQKGSDRVPGKTNGPMKAVKRKQDEIGKNTYTGFNDRYDDGLIRETRNRRSVWTVTTKPFKEAHFATFPPDLIEPCILAGCPLSGVVLDPFGGAGTTGLVANRLGRAAILCDLNPDYIQMAAKRIAADPLAEAGTMWL